MWGEEVSFQVRKREERVLSMYMGVTGAMWGAEVSFRCERERERECCLMWMGFDSTPERRWSLTNIQMLFFGVSHFSDLVRNYSPRSGRHWAHLRWVFLLSSVNHALSVCPSIRLSVCPSVRLSVSIGLSAHQSILLCLSVRPSLHVCRLSFSLINQALSMPSSPSL
jgi:hypothetical protein